MKEETRNLNVPIDLKLFNKFKKEAKRNGYSMYGYLNKILANHFAKDVEV